MVELISQNMRILRDEYGFDTIATRQACLELTGALAGSRVLDVGTGSGWMALVAARNGNTVWSLDLNLEALKRAKDRVANMPLSLQERIGFLIANGAHLPFRDGMFDSVLSFDVLHHFSTRFCPRAIPEMLRVCTPVGAVILSDLNAQGMRVVDEVIARTGEVHQHTICDTVRISTLLESAAVSFRRVEMKFVTVFVVERPPERVRTAFEVRIRGDRMRPLRSTQRGSAGAPPLASVAEDAAAPWGGALIPTYE